MLVQVRLRTGGDADALLAGRRRWAGLSCTWPRAPWWPPQDEAATRGRRPWREVNCPGLTAWPADGTRGTVRPLAPGLWRHGCGVRAMEGRCASRAGDDAQAAFVLREL